MKVSIEQSNLAKDILEANKGKVWTYSDAEDFFAATKSTIVNGVTYCKAYADLLPSTDLISQLKDVALKIGEAVLAHGLDRVRIVKRATDLLVLTLTKIPELVEDFQAGESLRKVFDEIEQICKDAYQTATGIFGRDIKIASISDLIDMYVSGNAIYLEETEHKLYLHVYDAQDRHVGYDWNFGRVEVGIPGACYLDLDGSILIVISSDITDFYYVIDARNATMPQEEYIVTIACFGNATIVSETTQAGEIDKNERHRYIVEISEDRTIRLEAPKETPSPTIALWILSVAFALTALIVAAIVAFREEKEAEDIRRDLEKV